MKKVVSITACLVALLSSNVHAAVLWSEDFADDWKSKWNPKWTMMANSNIVDNGTTMRCNFAAGGFGGGSGCQFPSQLPEEVKSDELYLSYNIRFSDNYEWTLGGKLPGLYAGDEEQSSGGNHPNGTNGFTSRVMWHNGNKLHTYLYVPSNQTAIPNKEYGWQEDVGFEMQGGKWYNFEQRIKLNTPGQFDGIYEQWVDGKSVIKVTGLFFRSNDFKIDGIYFSTFHGGNDPSWAPKTQGNYVEFKDFIIADAPVNGQKPTDDEVFLVDPEAYVGEAPDGVDDIGVNTIVENTGTNSVPSSPSATPSNSSPSQPVSSNGGTSQTPKPSTQVPSNSNTGGTKQPTLASNPQSTNPINGFDGGESAGSAPQAPSTNSSSGGTKQPTSTTIPQTPIPTDGFDSGESAGAAPQAPNQVGSNGATAPTKKPFVAAAKPLSQKQSLFVSPNGSATGAGSFENPLKSISDAVKKAVPGDTVFLDDGTYRLNAPEVIQNNGTNTNPITIKPFNESGVVIIDATAIKNIIEQAVINILGSYINLEGINIMNAPSDGIRIEGNNIKIADSFVSSSGGNGITVGSTNGAKTEKVRLNNNEVKNSGGTDKNSAAIKVQNASNVTMESNLIHASKGDGIALNDVNDSEILQNKIVDNNNANISLQAVDRVKVISNDITAKDTAVSSGIAIKGSDSPTSNLVIENNFVSNSDKAVTFENNSGAGNLTSALIKNNTIFNNKDASLGLDAPKSGVNDITFDSNIITPQTGSVSNSDSSLQGSTFSNNCFGDEVNMPSEASTGSNVSTAISKVNASLELSSPNNLTSTNNICRKMNAGVQGFPKLALKPSDLTLNETSEVTQPTANNYLETNSSKPQKESNTAKPQPVTENTPPIAINNSQPTKPEVKPTATSNNNQPQLIAKMVEYISKMVESIVASILQNLFGAAGK
jgi:Right handed beta helix region